MSAHTPGPWVVRGDHIEGPHPKDREGRLRHVAYVSHDAGTMRDEQVANIRLIAAVPDLLAALKLAEASIRIDRDSLAECHTGPNGIDAEGADAVADYDRVLQIIGAAIAKAVGP